MNIIWPISQIIPTFLVYIHWNEIYLSSFLCDVCNEINKYMK